MFYSKVRVLLVYLYRNPWPRCAAWGIRGGETAAGAACRVGTRTWLQWRTAGEAKWGGERGRVPFENIIL